MDKAKLKRAQQRDGHYLLRSNLTEEGPAVLWTRHVRLTQIESVFRSLNSEVWIPMVDGRWLVMPRHAEPDKDIEAVLDHLRIHVPSQLPRIRASQVVTTPAPVQPVLW